MIIKRLVIYYIGDPMKRDIEYEEKDGVKVLVVKDKEVQKYIEYILNKYKDIVISKRSYCY